jgi:hypothetical protein
VNNRGPRVQPQPITLPLKQPHLSCQPSRLAEHRAHGLPKGTRVTCPCGKVWASTKRHFNTPSGKRGGICGCGWALVAD